MSEVRIDGVLYVPVAEASPDYDRIMDALVAPWGGDDWRDLFSDAADYLRVIVTDSWEEGEGVSLPEFIARMLRPTPDQGTEGEG